MVNELISSNRHHKEMKEMIRRFEHDKDFQISTLDDELNNRKNKTMVKIEQDAKLRRSLRKLL
jgi:hypothetical protein